MNKAEHPEVTRYRIEKSRKESITLPAIYTISMMLTSPVMYETIDEGAFHVQSFILALSLAATCSALESLKKVVIS